MAKVEQTPTQGAEMTTEERLQASPITVRGLLLDDQNQVVTDNNTPRKSHPLDLNS